MRTLRSQAGQAAAEYVGALLVVSVIVAAVAGTDVGSRISRGLAHEVRCIALAGCAPAPAAPPAPGAASPQDAGASEPQPHPQPGPTPAAAWTGQAANLPQSGDRPYVPPKGSREPKRVPRTRGKGSGYEDADGNVWEWDPRGHGGPHWDVQHKDGSHTNVYPDGHVRGPDNFPNRPREAPGGSGDDGSDRGGDTAKAVGTGAAILGGGGLLWWLGKAASPACGPAAPVCAIVL